MKSGRNLPLVLLALVLVAGVAAFAFLRTQAAERAEEALLAAQAEARSQAAPPASETLTPLDAPALEASTAEAPADPPADSRTLAADERLEIEVQDQAGAPVGDARIYLYREDELLREAVTDASGLARCAAGEGSASFVLRLAGWDALQGELDLAAGRRSLCLPECGVVAGVVTVDGGLPPQAIEISWQADKRPPAAGEVPVSIRTRIEAAAGKRVTPKTSTDATGAFAFRRLPPQSSGSLRWEGPYLLAASANEFSGRRLAVSAPRTDLVLELTECLQLRLRVVEPEGRPVPGASVTARRETKSESGSRSSTTTLAADEVGVAKWIVGPDRFDRIVLDVSAKDGSGSKSYEFPWPTQARGVWDVGDLRVLATREVLVTVQDSSGAPIAGAQAYPWPTQMRRGDVRSDATGRIAVRIPEGSGDIAVAAFEYLAVRLSVPADATEAVAVLARACTLEFEVVGTNEKTENLVVVLEGPPPLFVGGTVFGGDGEPTTERAIGNGWSASTSDDVETFEAEPEKNGRWRISGLTPGIAVHAALKSGGRALAELDVPPLFDGERRSYTLTVPEGGRALRVRVLAPGGEPVPKADVWLFGEEGSGRYRTYPTEANGEVELPSIFGERCTILVTSGSYAPQTLRLAPLPVGTVEVRLEPARSVELELVDLRGAPITERAFVRTGDFGPRGSKASSIGAGRYRLDGLPRGVVPIEVTAPPVGSASFLHDTAVPFVRVVLGETGSVTVLVKRSATAEPGRCAVSIAKAGSPDDLARRTVQSGRTEEWANFQGLAPGAYEVWLLRLDPRTSTESWLRVGAPQPAVIDAEHPGVQVELVIPD